MAELMTVKGVEGPSLTANLGVGIGGWVSLRGCMAELMVGKGVGVNWVNS